MKRSVKIFCAASWTYNDSQARRMFSIPGLGYAHSDGSWTCYCAAELLRDVFLGLDKDAQFALRTVACELGG